MKYCVQYRNDLTCLDKVDEIRIKHFPKASIDSYKALFDQYPKAKFVIQINPETQDIDKTINFFSILQQDIDIHNKFCLAIEDKFAYLEELHGYSSLQAMEQNLPYFSLTPVSDWETLIYFISLGVSEVYIVNNFGFELKEIYEYLHTSPNPPVKIRCFPNIAQSLWNYADITSFFIRPEDVSIYEPYIDTLEIFDSPAASVAGTRIDTTFEIYKEGKWEGRLSDLILYYKPTAATQDIYNHLLPSFFGYRRLQCRRECQHRGRCSSCKNACIIAKTDERTHHIHSL